MERVCPRRRSASSYYSRPEGPPIANRKEEDGGAEPRLGEEGDVCAQCGTPLATDQRYCLTCGTPRAEPRLDYQRHLGESERASASGGRPGQPAGGVQWSPLLVVVAIAALGVMLLLGVLIGKDEGDLTVTEVPASTTTTTTPTDTTLPTTPTETTLPTTPTTTTPDEGAGTKTTPDAALDGAGGISSPGGSD
jgi:hypothetical protein